MASFANADTQINNIQQQFDPSKQIVSVQQTGKHLSLNFEEHVGVIINQPSDQNVKQQITGSQKFVSLSENVEMSRNFKWL